MASATNGRSASVMHVMIVVTPVMLAASLVNRSGLL
jgi:hypothetical protein